MSIVYIIGKEALVPRMLLLVWINDCPSSFLNFFHCFMSHDNKLNEMGLQIQSGMLLVKESWHPFAYDSLLKRNLLDFLFV